MHEIRLYGPIGGMFGISAESLLQQIPDDAKEVRLRIHSPGGSVGDGLAMYHALKDHPARIITVVDGYAASSASFVMLAGDEVQVHENSLVFVHKPWSVSEGNADDMRKSAEHLDKHEQAIVGIYMQRTGMGEEDLRNMMRDEEFLTGAEAFEMGFADVVIDSPEAKREVAALLNIGAKLEGVQMSTQKTRKEIQNELDEARAQLESVNADLTAKVDEVRAEYEVAIVAKDAEISAKVEELSVISAKLDEALAAQDAIKQACDEANATAESAKADAEAARADLDSVKAELSVAQNRLADPAFADAGLTVSVTDAAAQLDAEADEQEDASKQKVTADGKLILDSYWDHYYALPVEDRHAFYNEYKQELAAESQASE